jgi:hypothetical protein
MQTATTTQNNTTFHSGTNYSKVNDLILFADNTYSLVLLLDKLYGEFRTGQVNFDTFYDRLGQYTDKCITYYLYHVKQPLKLNREERADFLRLLVKWYE